MKTPFDDCAREYDIFRPDYPPEIYDFLINRCNLTAISEIVDVGAGTGKSSAPFLDRGFRVTAVEPSHAMRKEGLRSHPALSYVSANAESTGIRSGTFDLVICAQAFHWFDLTQTLPEFARLLKSSGFMGIFWNNRDGDAPHIQRFEKLIHEFDPEHDCKYRRKDWKSLIDSSNSFQIVDRRRFTFVKPMTTDAWVGLARSMSYVRKLPEKKLAELERALHEAFHQSPSTGCPYVTDLWLAKKL